MERRKMRMLLVGAGADYASMGTWSVPMEVPKLGLAIELLARGIWKDAGVYSPEYFDPDPYMELMKETGYRFGIEEKTP